MLPRQLRLKHRQDFQAVQRWGQRWSDGVLTLNIVPNGLPHSRFGFIVSRRTGKAVTRNLIKRRLRAAVRQWLPLLATGYDVVVVARPLASDATFQKLEAVLGKLFSLAGLLPVEDRS